MDFDDYDLEDAAIFGGIGGFVEESLREENRKDPSEPEESNNDEIDDNYENILSSDRQLQLLYAQNPSLAMHIIRKAKEAHVQGALRMKAIGLSKEIQKACEKQKIEESKNALSESTISETITKYAEYKWGDLSDDEYEKYPDIFFVEEAISEGWKIKFEYQHIDNNWEKDVTIIPKRIAKLENKIFILGAREKTLKEWYFQLDRITNINLIG